MPASYLGAIHADDAVRVARAVEVVGHADRAFAGRDPFLFGAGVDLEHVRFSGEDRLFPDVSEKMVKRVIKMVNLKIILCLILLWVLVLWLRMPIGERLK